MTVEEWLTSAPIAHRGFYEAAEGAPENSLSAFRRAVAHSVPFEFDVQYTADGSLVVWHDTAFPRADGSSVPVRDATMEDVSKVRLGDSEERVPSFSEVLETVNGQVPIVVDLRRWHIDRHSDLERAIATQLRGYTGSVALQSFDPIAVFRLKHLMRDAIVGQASGELHSANLVVATIGRTMATNAVTRPDFVSYEASRLPSFWATLWRKRGLPILAFPIKDARDEERARQLADNFFFADYVPCEYRSAVKAQPG